MAKEVKDWRGHSYELGEPLTRVEYPIGEVAQPCQWPDCGAQAVRSTCNAEGDPNRTHWHGGIHRLDGGPGSHFCGPHAARVLASNDLVRAARQEG